MLLGCCSRQPQRNCWLLFYLLLLLLDILPLREEVRLIKVHLLTFMLLLQKSTLFLSFATYCSCLDDTSRHVHNAYGGVGSMLFVPQFCMARLQGPSIETDDAHEKVNENVTVVMLMICIKLISLATGVKAGSQTQHF